MMQRFSSRHADLSKVSISAILSLFVLCTMALAGCGEQFQWYHEQQCSHHCLGRCRPDDGCQ